MRTRPIIVIANLTVLSFIGCKKSTDIDVHVLNPALNIDVPGATVVLVERKGSGGSGIFGGSAECSEVASAITNDRGKCSFSNEKLRKKANVVYFLAIKKSWGQEQGYPCGGKTSGFIEKGTANNQVLGDVAEGEIQVVYHDLLNPSQPGDSMFIALSTVEYVNPKDGSIVSGGGGVFTAFPFYQKHDPPNYPPIVKTEPIRMQAMRLRRYIWKRKLGVVTKIDDTISFMPNTLTLVDIFW